jgi:hypothetical protein
MFGDLGFVGAGVFFHLPTAKAIISQLANVNANCDPLPELSSANDTTSTEILSGIFGSLTNVVPTVELDLGLLANVEANDMKFNHEAQYTAMSTGFPLPTGCISYNTKDKAFLPAAAAVASASASASAGKKGGKILTGAGTASTKNPFTRTGHRLEVAMGILGLMMGCFIWGV